MIRILSAAVLLAGAPIAVGVPGQSFEEARSHWAYQPIVRPALPRVRDIERVQSPIDAFLLARLEAEGLTFGPPADPRTILRRVYYDLIGLPPTFEEIEAFARDPSPEALGEVVDRLLADPRYGERWARHWLDVARYADTKDLVLLYGKDALRPFAYTYRDYVIRAFNEDLPFDRFIRDQIAADLVEPPLPPWRLAALGFLTLGRLFDGNPHDQIDDQIDTVTRGFLGLTVACARCHDHKYDAITTEDYYGLYGVFASTERPYRLPLIESPADVPGGSEFEAGLGRRLAALEQHIDSQYDFLIRVLRERLPDYLIRAATTAPDITETTQFALSLTPDDFRPALMLKTRRLLQKRVNPDDRVFGLWAELAELPEAEFASLARELVARAAADPTRPDRNRIVTRHLADSSLSSMEDVYRAYGDLLRRHLHAIEERICEDEAYLETPDERELTALLFGETSPVWFAWRDTPDHMSRPDKDRYNALVLDLDKFAAHASSPPPARAMVVADLPVAYESRVFVRGNPSVPGRPAPRAFLRVLTGGEVQPFTRGSGRLELAGAITSPENPLTARVLVNRVWMHHFGEPIVASTADFGTRSDPPALPLLLDWLASEFIESGWSLKHLHRILILSSAYQLATPAASADDEPVSLALYRHGTRRRLDLESMRDTLLFVSGQLDSTMGGRPVDLTHDPFNRRRTIYGLVDRQNLPALYRAFDFAVPDQCVERRPRTTVPQQALFALNSPIVVEQARALAARPEIASLPPPERVQALFRRVLGRDPTSSEVARALSFLDEPGPDASLNRWEQFAQVLLISNEAVFLD